MGPSGGARAALAVEFHPVVGRDLERHLVQLLQLRLQEIALDADVVVEEDHDMLAPVLEHRRRGRGAVLLFARHARAPSATGTPRSRSLARVAPSTRP